MREPEDIGSAFLHHGVLHGSGGVYWGFIRGYDHSHAHNGVVVHLHTSLEAFKELPSTSIRETCAYLLGEPECLFSTASVLRSSELCSQFLSVSLSPHHGNHRPSLSPQLHLITVAAYHLNPPSPLLPAIPHPSTFLQSWTSVLHQNITTSQRSSQNPT